MRISFRDILGQKFLALYEVGNGKIKVLIPPKKATWTTELNLVIRRQMARLYMTLKIYRRNYQNREKRTRESV